jgi:hypothetical protein
MRTTQAFFCFLWSCRASFNGRLVYLIPQCLGIPTTSKEHSPNQPALKACEACDGEASPVLTKFTNITCQADSDSNGNTNADTVAHFPVLPMPGSRKKHSKIKLLYYHIS